MRDASSGEVYWWNKVLKEASWVEPRGARVAFGSKDPVWIPQTDDKGRTYFYNYRSGESRWGLEA